MFPSTIRTNFRKLSRFLMVVGYFKPMAQSNERELTTQLTKTRFSNVKRPNPSLRPIRTLISLILLNFLLYPQTL